MKPVRVISTGVLLLLLGTVASTYARQEQHEQAAKPEKQEQAKPEKQQQAAPARQAQQARPEKQQQAAPARQAQQARPEKQQQAAPARQAQQQAKGQQQQRAQQQANRPSPQQVQQQHAAWQGHRARNWQSEHRTWQQRGGYRIPDDRYRGYFGPDHWFRIYSYPVVVVGGYPRFRYNGFWFSIVDPWPEYWSDDWYENDDVYIEYSGGGYYMYDRRYPGVGIAVSVSLN